MGCAVRVRRILGFVVDPTIVGCFFFSVYRFHTRIYRCLLRMQANHHLYDTLLPMMFVLYSYRCQWLMILFCVMVSFPSAIHSIVIMQSAMHHTCQITLDPCLLCIFFVCLIYHGLECYATFFFFFDHLTDFRVSKA